MSANSGIFKDNHFLLLAPPNAQIPAAFTRVENNTELHEAWLTKALQLRGQVYLSDGAIREEQLDEKKRHFSRLDPLSWHFLVLSPEEKIRGVMRCQVWYTKERLPDLSELNIYALIERMENPELRQKFETTIEPFIKQPTTKKCFMEVSALAVDNSSQGFTIGSMLGISGYSIANLKNAYAAVGAGTDRHHTARFYHKLGGFSFRNINNPEEVLPPFHDSGYACQMDIMGFVNPAPAIKDMVSILEEKLCTAQVYVNR
jgi:hypothetical protein